MATTRLSLEEVRLLKPLAHKLERLERGEFLADTPARQHFLQVCRKDAEPETEIERAYLKWRISRPDLDQLETDLLGLAAKSQALQGQAEATRLEREAAVLQEKAEKRAAKGARQEEARRERRHAKELARREKKRPPRR